MVGLKQETVAEWFKSFFGMVTTPVELEEESDSLNPEWALLVKARDRRSVIVSWYGKPFNTFTIELTLQLGEGTTYFDNLPYADQLTFLFDLQLLFSQRRVEYHLIPEITIPAEPPIKPPTRIVVGCNIPVDNDITRRDVYEQYMRIHRAVLAVEVHFRKIPLHRRILS